MRTSHWSPKILTNMSIFHGYQHYIKLVSKRRSPSSVHSIRWGLAATFSNNQLPATPGSQRWCRPQSPTSPNLRSQGGVEGEADSWCSHFFCEWPTVIRNQSPANSLSCSQCSAGRVSPWMSLELCQSRWGILGGWLDIQSILVLQFSCSLVSELREMWLCQSTRAHQWQRLAHVYFWLSPDAVSLEELWHHSLYFFTRAWHSKWLIENVYSGCQYTQT